MTRILAGVVVGVCVLLATALVPGMVVAWRLAEWTVLALGGVGLVLLASVVWLTLALLRRQRQILQAGETLLSLRDEALVDPDETT